MANLDQSCIYGVRKTTNTLNKVLYVQKRPRRLFFSNVVKNNF